MKNAYISALALHLRVEANHPACERSEAGVSPSRSPWAYARRGEWQSSPAPFMFKFKLYLKKIDTTPTQELRSTRVCSRKLPLTGKMHRPGGLHQPAVTSGPKAPGVKATRVYFSLALPVHRVLAPAPIWCYPYSGAQLTYLGPRPERVALP